MKYLIGTLVVALYSGIVYYIGWNLKSLLQHYGLFRWPWLYWIVIVFIAFSFVIAKISPKLDILILLSYFWMFVMQYGLVLCLIANLVVWLTPMSSKVVGTSALGIFALLFVMGLYFAYTPVVHKQTITIDKEGEPMRVVLGADFHLGYLSHKGHLEKFVQLSNEQSPDLVLLAGDIIDDIPKQYINRNMGEVMQQLSSTYGVYGVLGNHEYYGNQIEQFLDAMENSNVKILMDETIELPNGVHLTGREDITKKSREAIGNLKPNDWSAPWFIMNHTPDDIQVAASAGGDFHVSGHTHRGQMWPNQFITERIFEVDYGYKLVDQMHTLVSSGFGFWGPPTRIGTQAEIWVIDIEFKK